MPIEPSKMVSQAKFLFLFILLTHHYYITMTLKYHFNLHPQELQQLPSACDVDLKLKAVSDLHQICISTLSLSTPLCKSVFIQPTSHVLLLLNFYSGPEDLRHSSFPFLFSKILFTPSKSSSNSTSSKKFSLTSTAQSDLSFLCICTITTVSTIT